MNMQFEVQGLKELDAVLQALPVKVEAKILRGAVRAGSKVIADDARARAPILKEATDTRVPGALKKSVRIMSTVLRRGAALGGVAAGGGAKVKRGGISGMASAFYAKFVEFGTAQMGAQPFMRPAGDSKASAAIDAAAAYTRDRVNAGDLK
jgi:HK97 gp10 family phage protein